MRETLDVLVACHAIPPLPRSPSARQRLKIFVLAEAIFLAAPRCKQVTDEALADKAHCWRAQCDPFDKTLASRPDQGGLRRTPLLFLRLLFSLRRSFPIYSRSFRPVKALRPLILHFPLTYRVPPGVPRSLALIFRPRSA